jgi:uncharacterized protein (TIGR02996 family)
MSLRNERVERLWAAAADPGGLAPSDRSVDAMDLDETLELLRREVLEKPDENTVRWIYADRLDELGHHAEAERIRDQLAHPELTHTVAGAKVGWPVITTATYRRGFVDEVTVEEDDILQLGDVVQDHPVALVRVEEIGLVGRIACGESDPDGIGGGHRSRPRRRWVVETRADPQDWPWVHPSTDSCNTRDELVEGIGPVMFRFVARVRLEHRERRRWADRVS